MFYVQDFPPCCKIFFSVVAFLIYIHKQDPPINSHIPHTPHAPHTFTPHTPTPQTLHLIHHTPTPLHPTTYTPHPAHRTHLTSHPIPPTPHTLHTSHPYTPHHHISPHPTPHTYINPMSGHNTIIALLPNAAITSLFNPARPKLTTKSSFKQYYSYRMILSMQAAKG